MFSRNSTFWHKIFWSENQLPNYRKGIRGAEKQNVFLTPWNYVISNILNNYPCLETLKSYYSHAWKSWFSHHRRILSSNSFFSRQKYLPPPFILLDPISRPGLLTSFHLVFTLPSLWQHKFWVFNITLSGPALPKVFVYYSINVKFVVYT